MAGKGSQGRGKGPKGNKGGRRSTLEKALVESAGEYFVLYRLSARGVLATRAARNAPTVDLLAMNPDETVVASLQVKTRTTGKDGGWHMRDKHERIVMDRYFYVFVDLEPQNPICYVVPSDVVAEVLKRSHAAWLATPGRSGRKRNDNEMRRVLPAYPHAVPGFPPGWLEEYRERWELLAVDGAAAPKAAAIGGST